ncbi:hypothetical protein SPRG_17021 [Saprolegnia parasitica CBS 223.65]|uniref:Uncharacterized protein n=1 Tax=Saprolegnia parasitica (strain CBS 223.65) TaxID=695850 RepID=A0A067BT49_SAPPC|nr:hypothetical protein SPRG_17021 [Saprolegnia parasitica CBS 223.65]KDO17466.1 hypothetical protein SPRG_17021 [Saprolegnia parasitica CBS 223.65]|eukprot:XP_012211828.1 hypothetical protein SPRG_17021 [Saprolegnia parasitica CBS 223.65]
METSSTFRVQLVQHGPSGLQVLRKKVLLRIDADGVAIAGQRLPAPDHLVQKRRLLRLYLPDAHETTVRFADSVGVDACIDQLRIRFPDCRLLPAAAAMPAATDNEADPPSLDEMASMFMYDPGFRRLVQDLHVQIAANEVAGGTVHEIS